jgi:hypothetical protein
MGAVSVTGPKTCLTCGKTISKYSRRDYCDECHKRPAESDTLDAELAVAEQEFGGQTMRPKDRPASEPKPKPPAPPVAPVQPRNNPSVRLTPVDELPFKHRGAFAVDVLREFLAGDADICKVEYNKVTANNVQTLFSASIRNNKLGHLCYATSRQGACYLVKIKPEEPLKKGK